MKVYYNYLPKQFSNTSSIFKDWKKLILSSEFTLGSFMRDFEIKFAKYIGAKYCISTNTNYSFLSSSLVKEVAKFGGEISHMVPLCVEKDLKEYFN